MTEGSPDNSKSPRDQLVEAISSRMLAAGASLRAAVAVSATVTGWASDHDVPDGDLLDLAERLTPTSPTEGGTP